MTLKLNYQMRHAVNLFGWNIILKILFRVVIPTPPNITIFTDASETGWGITDGHNPSEGQWAEHEIMHINVLYLKKTLWPLFMDGVFSLLGKVTSTIWQHKESTLHWYNSKMDCPALVPSNTGNENQQIHNQTCTKQSPAITRERELHSLHKNLTLAAIIKTVEIVSSNYILQPYHLQFWNIKPIKQNGTITACITIYPTFSLKEENCWTTLLIGIIQGHVKAFIILIKVPILCFWHHMHLF